jgi:hypothetical protein
MLPAGGAPSRVTASFTGGTADPVDPRNPGGGPNPQGGGNWALIGEPPPLPGPGSVGVTGGDGTGEGSGGNLGTISGEGWNRR